MKQHRWVDADGEESDDDHPITYLDTVHHPTKPVTVSPPRAQTCSIMILGHGACSEGWLTGT